MWRSVVGKCCREVSRGSFVGERSREVLWRSVVGKCCREVL